MAGKYDPMSGEMIRSHVTDAPISKDSFLYPIADFFNSISIPFTKHVAMLWVAALSLLLYPYGQREVIEKTSIRNLKELRIYMNY